MTYLLSLSAILASAALTRSRRRNRAAAELLDRELALMRWSAVLERELATQDWRNQ